MTTKELAYSIHQRITTETGVRMPRSHTHELIAAGFGFKTYAALGCSAVLAPGDLFAESIECDRGAVENRCKDMGYAPSAAVVAAAEMIAALRERSLRAVRLTTLVAVLLDEDAEGVPELSEMVLAQLRVAADRDVAEAHLALALVLEPQDYEDDLFDAEELDESTNKHSAYWYERQQQGEVLSGPELQFAREYEQKLARDEQRNAERSTGNIAERKISDCHHHLRAAARLGSADAALMLADYYGEAPFDDSLAQNLAPEDVRRVGRIAQAHGADEDAYRWLTVAAEKGDTASMRQLIRHYDVDDLKRCWIWVLLAKRLGADIRCGIYGAVNDAGEEWDEDTDGDVYPIDIEEEVELDDLDIDDMTVAREAADNLYRTIVR